MIFIKIFLVIIILKFIYNLFHFINNFRLYKIWKSFYSQKQNINAITYTNEIKTHLVKAGIKDSMTPISIPTGHNMIANTSISMMNNIFTNTEVNINYFQFAFLEARGVYRSRMLESFKPSYWASLVIFLPKNIIQYLGLDANTIFTKIFQLIYWLIDSILIAYYQEDIILFFQELIIKLFK